MLLRTWIQQAATQKLHAAAQQAVHEHLASQQGGDPHDPAAPPIVSDVGIVYALGIELGALEDRLQNLKRIRGDGFTVRHGQLGEKLITLVESGPGQAAAAKATAALIAAHHPPWIISAGFGGGLVKEMKRRDFLMANEIANPSGGRLTVDFAIRPEALKATPNVHVGRLLTVDQIVRTSAEKKALAAAHDAWAVDMETYAVADVCRREHVRFMSVRIISDAVDDELPREVENLINQKSTAGRLGAALGAIVHRPSSVKDLWQLKEDALVSSQRLTKFLEGIIQQLTGGAK